MQLQYPELFNDVKLAGHTDAWAYIPATQMMAKLGIHGPEVKVMGE